MVLGARCQRQDVAVPNHECCRASVSAASLTLYVVTCLTLPTLQVMGWRVPLLGASEKGWEGGGAGVTAEAGRQSGEPSFNI